MTWLYTVHELRQIVNAINNEKTKNGGNYNEIQSYRSPPVLAFRYSHPTVAAAIRPHFAP